MESKKSFLRTILLCQNEKELQAFFDDLLTTQEREEFERRWEAAQYLLAGESYTEISRITGLSSTTIARISRFCQEGAGGYRLLYDRIREGE